MCNDELILGTGTLSVNGSSMTSLSVMAHLSSIGSSGVLASYNGSKYVVIVAGEFLVLLVR